MTDKTATAFLSHASRDDAFVMALRQAIEIFGGSAWADSRELLPGDVLQTEIEKAISESSVFFLVFSAHALQSKWVKKELEYARSQGKRIVVLLLDEQTTGALAWMFDEEPLAISVSTAPGGLQKAMPQILTALGLRLPEDARAAVEVSETTVSELLLVLETPVLYTEGGVRRGSARARLDFLPADGSDRVESPWFSFVSPLGPDVADRIRWYVEDFPRYPFVEKILDRAREIDGQLPQWGKALLEAITTDEEARTLLYEWKGDKHHERRFSIKLDAAAVPAGLGEEAKAGFYEAAGLLLSTPWEILHDGQGYLFQGQRPVRVRRMQPNRRRKEPLPPQDVLRILLVAPRPEDQVAGLIDHRAATRALLKAVEALGDLAELDILETPTFAALTQKIRQAAAQGRPYSVVHFDGHGVFDRNKGLGALCFESAEAAEQAKLQGRATAIVDARELASELNELRIPLFFLDACQSAQTDHDPTASVAATLLENGVASVAAMSHSVLVTAAEQFAVAFYQTLAEGALIGTAMLAGQKALHADPVRAHLPGGDKLRLQDWFVPVLFQEKKDPQLVRIVPNAQIRQTIDEQSAARQGDTPPPPPHGFVGRDRELLALERLLLQERHAVLIGQGGAGKTTLATELARWMLRTRRVQRLAFVSFEYLSEPRAALDALGKQLIGKDFSVAADSDEQALLEIDRRLREYRTLIVLDNLESILPAPGGEPLHGVAPVEAFVRFFSRLQKGSPNTRLLFTSREMLPQPFDTPRHTVRIGPLAARDALRLIAEVMRQEGIEVPSLNSEDLDKQFGNLARTANYHARALTLLTKTLAGRKDELPGLTADLSELMVELEAKNPGDRENSLFASLELSLRRLPPEMRNIVDALAVFHGGADLATWSLVVEKEGEEVIQAGLGLISVGLAEMMLNRPPYFFRIDPALPAFCAFRTSPDVLTRWRMKWLESMTFFSSFLYEQLFRDTRLAYDLGRLSEANLVAMLALMEQDTDFNRIVNVAGRLETLFSKIGRHQVVVFAQELREKAAGKITDWNHLQFIHRSTTIDRLVEQGNLRAAYQLAKETQEKCEQVASQQYPEADYDKAMSYSILARVLKKSGQPDEALPYLEASRRLFISLSETGDRDATRMASACITEIGDCYFLLGKYDAAARQYEEGIALDEKRGDARDVATGKGQLATIRMYQENYSEALRLFQEVKTVFEEYGELGTVAIAWHQIGMVYQESKNFPAAEQAYQESLAIKIREKNRSGEASTVDQLGILYSKMGKMEDAVRMHELAASIRSELGDLFSEGKSRHNLAVRLISLKRFGEARIQLRRAIECGAQFGHAVENWKTWDLLSDLESFEGNATAYREARQKAVQAYAAYRKDGGESQCNRFKLIHITAQVVQANNSDERQELSEYLKSTLEPGDPQEYVACVNALLALLNGSRDPAIAGDPELNYMDSVEINLLFFNQ